MSEYKENLKRLGITDYNQLVGETVHYVKPSYGKHKVIKWDEEIEQYLLDLQGSRFYSNPFRIKLIEL